MLGQWIRGLIPDGKAVDQLDLHFLVEVRSRFCDAVDV